MTSTEKISLILARLGLVAGLANGTVRIRESSRVVVDFFLFGDDEDVLRWALSAGRPMDTPLDGTSHWN